MLTANIYSYIESTSSEGPGKRFVIWFQGCLQRCKGCCNEKLLRIENKNIMSVETILEKIKLSKKNNNIEGVTFLGGEPILQIYALIEIAKFCKLEGLTVMLFSGYYRKQIEYIFQVESKELFSNIDVLIDGPFDIENLDNDRRWIGSKNQNIHFMTTKYNNSIFYKNNKKTIEIRSRNKGVIVNGWPVNYKKQN